MRRLVSVAVAMAVVWALGGCVGFERDQSSGVKPASRGHALTFPRWARLPNPALAPGLDWVEVDEGFFVVFEELVDEERKKLRPRWGCDTMRGEEWAKGR